MIDVTKRNLETQKEMPQLPLKVQKRQEDRV